MTLRDYIDKLRLNGKLEEYADNCGVSASYMDRMLKHGYYIPKQKTIKALYRKSKGNVRKSAVVEHFYGSDL